MPSSGLEPLIHAVKKAGSASALARALGYDDAKTARLRRALRGDTDKVGSDLVEDARAYLSGGNNVSPTPPGRISAEDYLRVHEPRAEPYKTAGDVCLFVLRGPDGRRLMSYWIVGRTVQDAPPLELTAEVPAQFS